MRIRKLTLEGYGLFLDRTLELSPGFQVIVGPNEQGKSTLRNFIGDMLYGQRCGAARHGYDPAHELRRPWGDPNRYGGVMVYELDDGRTVEVSRCFEDKHESLHVRDQTHDRDITDEFERLSGGEPAFALSHLGLTKDVFLSAATITHMTLEALGDKDALSEVREKLLSLADSGEETVSAEMALEWLSERIDRIGRHGASNRPLPAARARLAALNEECDAALALRKELAGLEEKRRRLLEEERMLRKRRVKLREELVTLERIDRTQRLADADRFTEQIDAVTRRCIELGSVREFPLDRARDVQRAETAIATARAQLDHLRGEREVLERRVATERERLGPDAEGILKDIPEEVEARLAELETKTALLRDRLDEAAAARDATRTHLEEAVNDLAGLPDFSRVAPDPVEWVTDLNSSFRVAQRARDDECAKRGGLHQDVQRRQAMLTGPHKVFADCDDFLAMARDYDLQTHVVDDQVAGHMAEVGDLEADIEQFETRLPGFRNMAILCAIVLAALLGVAYAAENPGVLIPSTLAGLCVLWFLGNWMYSRDALRRAKRRLQSTQTRLGELRSEGLAHRETVDRMMREADCATVRELEALYDQYRENTVQLEILEQAAEEQDARGRQAEENVARLLEQYRQTFADVGVQFETEAQLDDATSVAITRYQEYRDAKRRRMEAKALLDRHEGEVARLNEELDAALETERDLSLQVRQDLRDSGYTDEKKHAGALRALRSYRIRAAQVRERRGRVGLLAESLADLDSRIAHEEAGLERHEATLAQCLEAGGVDSVEAWHERAQHAREYHEHWDRRTTLANQLEAVLRGQDLDALRTQVEADGPAYGAPERDIDALDAEVQDIADRIETLQQQEHALHIALAERAGSTRSLNEVEEDRATLECRIEALDLGLRAASYAMARIDEVSRDKHSRIAPRLAKDASEFLREITDGAYEQLLIDRNLRIRVRIPETNRLDKNAQQQLSKGTVDQIYLALRLAMVRILSESHECVPMLLDDPFANYDDHRLERTMTLLARLARHHQILLFTCRDDVARAAERVNAPILAL